MDKRVLITSINRIRKLNAFTSLIDLDKINIDKSSRLPLHGTTFCVKDNFCTSGIRTTCGSKYV